MTTRFKNAIDALVHAFFNDTLAKGECTACACANIVAHAAGVKLNPSYIEKAIHLPGGYSTGSWYQLMLTQTSPSLAEIAHKCIASTGFSVDEFKSIEKAFEGATKINYISYRRHTKSEIMEDQYLGLCAVVDVLCEIEGIEDPSEYKAMFSYA